MYLRFVFALVLLAPVAASAVNLIPIALQMPSAEAEAFDRNAPIFNCSQPIIAPCTSLGASAAGPDSISFGWSLPTGGGSGTFAAGIDASDFVMSHSGTLVSPGASYGVAGQVQLTLEIPDLGLPTTSILFVPTVENSSIIGGQPDFDTQLSLLCEIGYVTPSGAGCVPGYDSTVLGTAIGLEPGATYLNFFRMFESSYGAPGTPLAFVVDFQAGDSARFTLHVDTGAYTFPGGLSFDQEVRLSAFVISNSVPEPSIALLLTLACIGVAAKRRRH